MTRSQYFESTSLVQQEYSNYKIKNNAFLYSSVSYEGREYVYVGYAEIEKKLYKRIFQAVFGLIFVISGFTVVPWLLKAYRNKVVELWDANRTKSEKIHLYVLKQIEKQVKREVQVEKPESETGVKNISLKKEQVFFPEEVTSEDIKQFENQGEKAIEIEYVKKSVFHYYECMDNPESKRLKDSGWGCAWRSLKTILSAIDTLQKPVADIIHAYSSPEQILKAYKHDSQIKLTEEQEKQICQAAPSLHGNWAEPFIGHLYLKNHGISSSLALFRQVPTNMYAPKFAFPQLIEDFSSLTAKLVEHFRTQKCPIMLDDGIYAYAMLGIKVTEHHIHFWMADPHTTEGKTKGLYSVILDRKTGQALNLEDLSAGGIVRASQALNFNSKGWMFLFPAPIVKATS